MTTKTTKTAPVPAELKKETAEIITNEKTARAAARKAKKAAPAAPVVIVSPVDVPAPAAAPVVKTGAIAAATEAAEADNAARVITSEARAEAAAVVKKYEVAAARKDDAPAPVYNELIDDARRAAAKYNAARRAEAAAAFLRKNAEAAARRAYVDGYSYHGFDIKNGAEKDFTARGVAAAVDFFFVDSLPAVSAIDAYFAAYITDGDAAEGLKAAAVALNEVVKAAGFDTLETENKFPFSVNKGWIKSEARAAGYKKSIGMYQSLSARVAAADVFARSTSSIFDAEARAAADKRAKAARRACDVFVLRIIDKAAAAAKNGVYNPAIISEAVAAEAAAEAIKAKEAAAAAAKARKDAAEAVEKARKDARARAAEAAEARAKAAAALRAARATM